jgi:hypothetical protein
MCLDESLNKAFDTIREAACFDSHSLVPHPENLKFQANEERRAMHRLGTKLAEIVASPDGEDLQHCAQTVRRHFWKDLGLSQPPELATNVPRFLLKPDHKIELRTDPQELADKLVDVAMPETPVLCIVASKLALLQKLLLNLSDTAIKYLTLAYANCSTHSLTKDESSSLKIALSHICVADNMHRNRAVAVLLDVPVAAVDAMFAAPSALVALRFVDASAFNQRRTLRDVFALTDEFVTLLETPFRSHEALLAGILEPEQDFDLLDDGTPIGYLYEILPKDIAEAYECAVLGRPLNFMHIHDLVSWYTAGYRMLPSFYSPLAGRITVESVRDAIKRAAMKCAQANKPLNAHALVKALYAAST